MMNTTIRGFVTLFFNFLRHLIVSPLLLPAFAIGLFVTLMYTAELGLDGVVLSLVPESFLNEHVVGKHDEESLQKLMFIFLFGLSLLTTFLSLFIKNKQKINLFKWNKIFHAVLFLALLASFIFWGDLDMTSVFVSIFLSLMSFGSVALYIFVSKVLSVFEHVFRNADYTKITIKRIK